MVLIKLWFDIDLVCMFVSLNQGIIPRLWHWIPLALPLKCGFVSLWPFYSYNVDQWSLKDTNTFIQANYLGNPWSPYNDFFWVCWFPLSMSICGKPWKKVYELFSTWDYWIKKKIWKGMNKEYEIRENLTCASTSLTSLEKEVLLISWRDNDDAAPAVPDCLSKCSQILSGIVKWEFLMPSWFHEIIFLIFKHSELRNISCTKTNLIYHAPILY